MIRRTMRFPRATWNHGVGFAEALLSPEWTEPISRTLDNNKPDVDPAADQPVLHRVEGVLDRNMIIGMDFGPFPPGIFERMSRQRSQRRTLELLEQFMAEFADMPHRPVVEILQQHRDRGVELGQTEEAAVGRRRCWR